MKIQWSLILALVFALITALFAVINVEPVQVNLLFSSVQIPLILLILGSTLLGGIIVGSFGIYRGYKLQKEVKQLNAQLVQLQETPSSNLNLENSLHSEIEIERESIHEPSKPDAN